MSKALLRHIRLSPTKARLIAREIQGMNAELAIASLEFTPNKAARIISKVVASAVANGGYDAQDVVITSCRVDAGPVLRRFMPRAKGRATPIRKPTSHVFVEVGTLKKSEQDKRTKGSKRAGKEIAKEQKSAQIESKEFKRVESKDSVVKSQASKSKGTESKTTKPKTTTAKASKKTEGEGK
ncbi:50S ribosomal protein L22 [uncultured Helicobacter sp.]|uniref:50S ribosomal protein L22 n=1 Tax=uncultured Helicobacter sp. TaxID=175537 RepID=UPI0037507BB1